MAKKVILLGLAVLLAMAPIGCGSDNNNNNDDDDAVLNVFAQSSDASSDFASKSAATDVAGLQALTITFSELELRRTDGEYVVVVDQDSELNTVDLVAALGDPQQLASFNIPQGDYNGIRGFIDVVDDDMATWSRSPMPKPRPARCPTTSTSARSSRRRRSPWTTPAPSAST